MEVSFVRSQGSKDRIYVRRTNGTEVSWVFSSFGNYIPHDLAHLVVEAAFGLRQGFWGRVDAGVDPGRVNADANRLGGPDKFAAYGPDQVELMVAEFLANTRWGDSDLPDENLSAEILRNCPMLTPFTTERIAQVRRTLDSLCGRWIELVPKGAIRVQVDFGDLERSFFELSRL